MKILFSTSFPIGFGGYQNQMNYLVNQINDYNPDIEIAFMCLNLFMPFSEDEMDPELVKNEITKVGFPDFYHKIKYYCAGDIFEGSYWKKLKCFYDKFKPDVILVYYDMWMVGGYDIPKLNSKIFFWHPIHDSFVHTNGNSMYKYSILKILPVFDKILTFSEFGQDVIKSYNYEPLFINHFIDPAVFYPKYTKKIARNGFNISMDLFVCFMIINVQSDNRKGFLDNLQAFQDYQNPNKFLIFKNSERNTKDIEKQILEIPELKNRIYFINDCVSVDTLVRLYCAADVLLAAAHSEGFGLPIVEAQFCGLPVITTKCTAMPENTYNGICVEPESVTEVIGKKHNSWSKPSVSGIVKALEDIESGNYIRKDIDRLRYNSQWDKWKKLFCI